MLFSLSTISDVLVANLITVGFAYFAWRVRLQERITGSSDGLPVWVYALGVLPGIIIAASAYSGGPSRELTDSELFAKYGIEEPAPKAGENGWQEINGVLIREQR